MKKASFATVIAWELIAMPDVEEVVYAGDIAERLQRSPVSSPGLGRARGLGCFRHGPCAVQHDPHRRSTPGRTRQANVRSCPGVS